MGVFGGDVCRGGKRAVATRSRYGRLAFGMSDWDGCGLVHIERRIFSQKAMCIVLCAEYSDKERSVFLKEFHLVIWSKLALAFLRLFFADIFQCEGIFFGLCGLFSLWAFSFRSLLFNGVEEPNEEQEEDKSHGYAFRKGCRRRFPDDDNFLLSWRVKKDQEKEAYDDPCNEGFGL